MTPLATAAASILQAAQLAAENGPALLAIDGRCGSGKSTLAEFLAGQLGCRVVHTDDFYLPLARALRELAAAAPARIWISFGCETRFFSRFCAAKRRSIMHTAVRREPSCRLSCLLPRH